MSWSDWKSVLFKELVGHTLADINGGVGDEEITFTTVEDVVFRQVHHNDCCENVAVDDICGNMDDLIGTPILKAEEAVNDVNLDPLAPANEEALGMYELATVNLGDEEEEYDNHDSNTWTFYHIRTVKGVVTIKWWGSSNGYYSESVSFERRLTKDEMDERTRKREEAQQRFKKEREEREAKLARQHQREQRTYAARHGLNRPDLKNKSLLQLLWEMEQQAAGASPSKPGRNKP